MKKSKILYLSDAPIHKAGGAQISMKIIMDGLKQEYDFYLISPGSEVEFDRHILIAGYQTIVPSKNGILKTLDVLFKIRKGIIDIEPDIIHVQTSSAAILINLLKVFRLISRKIAIIYTDREVYAKYGSVSRKSIDHLLKYSEYVITTTQNNYEHYHENYNKFFNSYNRFRVIPNTAGLNFENSAVDYKRSYPLNHQNEIVIGFCSRFIPNKNWSLVKAIIDCLFKRTKNVKVIAAIGSDESTRDEMFKFINHLNGQYKNRISIRVDVDSETMVKLYDEMDIFILTSKVESFGRTAVEAMARKTVVMGTRIDGIPEVIGEEEYLYSNADEAVEKIVIMTQSRDDLEKRKDAFFKRYYNKYSTYSNCKSHEEIYNNTINRKNNMRLLFIGPLPPPIGGDTVSFSRIIETPYFEQYYKKIIDTSRKGSIRITGRRTDFKDILNGIKVLLRVIKNGLNHDVVIFYSNRRFLYTVGLGIVLIEKIFRKKIIIRVFGGSFHKELNRLPTLYKKISLSILRKIDYLLVQSKELHDNMLNQFNFSYYQVIYYPNFVPDSIIKQNVSREKPTDLLKIVYIGQIKREKGIFEIINAREINNSFTCDFYGPIFSRDQSEFNKAIESTEGLSYQGVVSREDVCKTISSYDILILPSYHEGEGYAAVVFEAFSVGVPVIVTRWNAFPEFIEENVNGIMVPIKDEEAIAKAINRLNENHNLLFAMREGALRTSEQYSEKQIVGGIFLPLIEKMR